MVRVCTNLTLTLTLTCAQLCLLQTQSPASQSAGDSYPASHTHSAAPVSSWQRPCSPQTWPSHGCSASTWVGLGIGIGVGVGVGLGVGVGVRLGVGLGLG